MMPDMFLDLPCLELVSCSCSCKQWLDILKHGFSWKEYCMGFKLPMPLCSYEALRRYAACLVIVGRCLLRYKVYVDRRRSVPWHRPLCDATGVCDLLGLGGPSCMSRNGFASPLREHLQTLFLFFGALPCDYVAALHTVWRPGKDFALGDVLLIQNGVPFIGSMCKDPVTSRCAVSIGYICPNGYGGHVLDYDFDVYELIMSYHVNTRGQAIDVCYNGVCHDQIGIDMVGPSVRRMPLLPLQRCAPTYTIWRCRVRSWVTWLLILSTLLWMLFPFVFRVLRGRGMAIDSFYLAFYIGKGLGVWEPMVLRLRFLVASRRRRLEARLSAWTMKGLVNQIAVPRR